MRIFKHISFYILILFCISSVDIYAQVVVERSENRVIISGVSYYIHIVKSGETAYSISRAYGIRVDDIVKENPSAVYGINVGQSLRIPADLVRQADEMQTQPIETKPRDEENYIYHIIAQGETIYSLSRQYDVSDYDIIQSNQGIDVNHISIGTEIAIPRKQLTTNSQRLEVRDDAYYHRAQRGESLASIARQYNVALRDLRRENPNIRFLQAGDNVRIPGLRVEVRQEIIADSEPPAPIDSDEPIWVERPAAPTNFTKLSGKIDMAVLLPFYLNENIRTGSESPRDRRPEDWIYPGSIDFIEMYEGILLAVDTLRALGVDINIHAYDIQSDATELSRLIRAGNLRDMDLIIGPVYSNNLRTVTEYARTFDIPVISPVSLFNNSLLAGNPNLFMASPTLEVAKIALAKKIAEEHSDHNIIFIHTDSLRVDEDVRQFRDIMMRELSTRMPSNQIRFRDMLFLSRSRLGNNNSLDNMLDNQTGNVVIIASEHAPVISETIMNVHGLSRRFDVKVFGYPLLRELENLEPRIFFDLDMFLYSTSWIDYTQPNVRKFNADFRTKFFTQPSEISFAWQGYDIAYYFISGLALYGKDFIKNPSVHRPELLHTDYHFVRRSAQDGFENQKLFPIRYTKDFDVILEEIYNAPE